MSARSRIDLSWDLHLHLNHRPVQCFDKQVVLLQDSWNVRSVIPVV